MSNQPMQTQRLKKENLSKTKSLSEERLDICLSAGNLAWWEMDCTTGKVIFNENKVKMLGYDIKDFSDVDYTAFTNIVHPDDYEPVMQAMQDLLEGKKKLYEVDYRIKTKNNLYRWFHDRGSIVAWDNQGKPKIVKGVVFDITGRKNAEQKLADNLSNLESLIDERNKQLIETNKRLSNEVMEREKRERLLARTKDYLRNVIDSASELIISFDMNHRLSTWNKTAEEITGYKQIEVLNRSVDKLAVFETSPEVNELITSVCETQDTKNKNIILRTKTNEKRIIRIAASDLKGNEQECLGALFIGHDITRDLDIHGKLVDGNSYLIVDEQSSPSFDLFLNLTYLGRKGLYITRSTPSMIRRTIPNKNITVIVLSQTKNTSFKTINDLVALQSTIESFSKNNKNTVILFEGIHYYLTRYSFQQVIEHLYIINEIIAKHKSILFLRIDPNILEPAQMAVLTNEFLQLPSQKIEDVVLKDETYSVLRYVAEQNQLNAVVSIKKIMSKFQIAFATAASRIASLEKNDLLFTKKSGKIKAVYLTDKGKKLLQKRQTL